MASRKFRYDFDDTQYEMQSPKRRSRLIEDDEDEIAPSEYPELEGFFTDGLISEVLYMVKSGKEATVYCCKAGPALEAQAELVAAKVYRARQNRNFKNDAIYQEGRIILDSHASRAVKKKTEFGRKAQFALWIGHEFEHLKMLYAAGAAIPKPYRQDGSAILMEYLGDYEQAAPILNRVELEPKEVRPLFDFMLNNVELWLKHNLVHADLSPFNVLYWQGQLKIIDFPQAVDPRFNPNAYALLERDIGNLCGYWARYGLEANAARLATRLWTRFQNSQL